MKKKVFVGYTSYEWYKYVRWDELLDDRITLLLFPLIFKKPKNITSKIRITIEEIK